MSKLCHDLKYAKQTYVDAKDDIARHVRETLDEEVGPVLADLEAMQDSIKLVQEDNTKLQNCFELLTSATKNIKTEMNTVLERVDVLDSAINQDMELLQKDMGNLQESATQFRGDVSRFDDKIRTASALVDRNHKTFTHDIKDSYDRYASLSAKLEKANTSAVELEASMSTYTDEQFAKAMAHTDNTAQCPRLYRTR